MTTRHSIKNFNYTGFVNDVRRVRIASQWYITESFLSKQTGMSQSTINRILNYSESIKISQFLKICEACELDPHKYL